jgi:hypothetical protein
LSARIPRCGGEQTCAAVESALGQRPGPAQECQSLRAVVLPGLSGARNAGLRAATQVITAFLDDDGAARPGCWYPSSSHAAAPILWPLEKPRDHRRPGHGDGRVFDRSRTVRGHRRTRSGFSPVERSWSRAGRYTAAICKEKLDNHSLPGKAPGGGAPRLACPEHPSVAFSPAGTLHR